MQILKVIGLLMEYPDELLWECKEDALALIRSDAPMLTDFTHNLLNAPLLDKQAEWCEVFDRGRTTVPRVVLSDRQAGRGSAQH